MAKTVQLHVSQPLHDSSPSVLAQPDVSKSSLSLSLSLQSKSPNLIKPPQNENCSTSEAHCTCLISLNFLTTPPAMSQQQPQRPQPGQAQAHADPIKYGDVFPTVQGELAREPIKPQDAAMMQSAENLVMGQTQRGGPAAVMQSAATKNEQAGLVGHGDVSDVPADRGVTVSETDLPGRRIISESVAGQLVGQYTMPAPLSATAPGAATVTDKITIGEALEAAAMTAGDEPIEQSDAAAIQAAEVRATGINENIPGGIAAAAQAAANANVRVMRDDDKTKLGDVLADAATKLPADKEVTRGDAEKVIAAELRNNPNMITTPGGVAASVAAAARLNQESC